MEQIPAYLHAQLLGGFERRHPARPVVLARRFLNQVPAQAVAHSPEAKLAADPVILEYMLIVRSRLDQIEANPVLAPVRRALETRLEETVEACGHDCGNNALKSKWSHAASDLRPVQGGRNGLSDRLHAAVGIADPGEE